uniref:Putative secreted protein n=1 Tax=Anopheles marajoara TaxID=58244 RepID=A0A2M4CF43_9DIPT
MIVWLNERNILSVGLLFIRIELVCAARLRLLLRGDGQGHRFLRGTLDITLFRPTTIVVIVCGGPRDHRC